jgi:hypothetical protein
MLAYPAFAVLQIEGKRLLAVVVEAVEKFKM